MEKASSTPWLATVAFSKFVLPQWAQAFRLLKNLAPQLVHWLATK